MLMHFCLRRPSLPFDCKVFFYVNVIILAFHLDLESNPEARVSQPSPNSEGLGRDSV